MIKLIVFDLDNTLCPVGGGMSARGVALLRELEDGGARIAIASGKPTYYLCGFMRQIGLKAPIFVGENGAVIHVGVDLPPSVYRVTEHTQAAKDSIALLKAAIDEAVPDIWYQPNAVGLTPFPRSDAEFDAIQACIDRLSGKLRDVIVYRHGDSFDVTPDNITKKSGVLALCGMLGVSPEETAAVGDGVNDYPMFEVAGLALGVNVADAARVQRNFACVEDAMAHLLRLAGG